MWLQVMHPDKLTVSRAASLAQTVHKWKVRAHVLSQLILTRCLQGHVIWDVLAGDSSAVSADIAVSRLVHVLLGSHPGCRLASALNL